MYTDPSLRTTTWTLGAWLQTIMLSARRRTISDQSLRFYAADVFVKYANGQQDGNDVSLEADAGDFKASWPLVVLQLESADDDKDGLFNIELICNR